jgi:hypothetical protein
MECAMREETSTNAALSRVYKTDDGTPHLVFLASGPKPDKTRPIPERMTEKSLNKMVEQAKAGAIKLTPSHVVPIMLGKSVDGYRDGEGNVVIDFAMKPESPLANEVFKEFESGEWDDRQISVGGSANHIPVYDATLKAKVVELDDMDTNHACLTFPGKAYYPDAGCLQAVHKAVSEGDTATLKAKGLTDEEAAEVVKTAKREDVKPSEGENKYGDVEFADAKNKKYPIDTVEHIRAAWNYINKAKNAAKYSAEDVKAIKAKIISAWKSKIDKDGPPSAEKGDPMWDVKKAQAALIERAGKLGIKLEPVEKAMFQPDTWAYPSSKKIQDALNGLYALSLVSDLVNAEASEDDLADEDKAQLASLLAAVAALQDFIASEIQEIEQPPAPVAMAQDTPKGDDVAKAEKPKAEVTKADLSEVSKALTELRENFAKASAEVQALKEENAALKADVAKALAVPVEPGKPVFKDANGQPTDINPEAGKAIALPFEVVKAAYAESKDMAEFQHKLVRLTAEASVNAALQRK